MRIVHTSDWHIGHKLYEQSRTEEHQQFLEWLLKLIKDENINLLLVSGDIFDSALPSAESIELYYKFLFRLYEETSASAVIIAGNHDSAVRLSAPRQFLEMARINVIGKLPNQISGCVINKNGVYIIALPYIPEGEILSHVSFENQIDVALRYREAIKKIYYQCITQIPPGYPTILMGHFFVAGGEESGSERTIQIGGTQSIRTVDLPKDICYAALGHIHRPQQLKNTEFPIIYSGSPLPMTFIISVVGTSLSG